MRYVSTGGAKDDTAARRLASLRTSMVKDEVRVRIWMGAPKRNTSDEVRRYFFLGALALVQVLISTHNVKRSAWQSLRSKNRAI